MGSRSRNKLFSTQRNFAAKPLLQDRDPADPARVPAGPVPAGTRFCFRGNEIKNVQCEMTKSFLTLPIYPVSPILILVALCPHGDLVAQYPPS